MSGKQYARLTEEQISAIKFMICVAPQGSELMKQAMYALLDKSKGCTTPVHLTLHEGDEYDGREIHYHFLTTHGMHSCNAGTHLCQCMQVSGTKFYFSEHYGAYRHGKFNSDGIFPGHNGQPRDAPTRYTMWLGPSHYGHAAKSKGLKIPRAKLEAIEISQHVLYPNTEGITYHFGALEHQVPAHLRTEAGQIEEMKKKRRSLEERLAAVEGHQRTRDEADRKIKSMLGMAS